MVQRAVFDKTDLHLVRVFHTVVSERSVSRAALLLSSTQPQISAQLKRLRALIGDPLLVRSGSGMAATEVALQLLAPAETLLRSAETLFSGKVAARGFVPATAETEFRIAGSDYLDPLFLPTLIAHIKQQAPRSRITVQALSADFDYRAALSRGDLDLVIGNWLEPPEELHLGRLFSDDVVCLVAADHPALRNPRGWTLERYLDCEHLAPTALAAGARGVIDEQLGRQGLQRRVTVRTPHFSLAPMLVSQSQLVLTTGRLFCSRFLDHFPVRILRCPVEMPPLTYYQLWHDVAHNTAAVRWLRETVRDVARGLMAQPNLPPRLAQAA